ncbi:unnamed protein product [Porites evermanni]|uniref:Uncharacterized protein n=1 Tax=Porites evermanni TaxID=104178 RepID=A0ABN8QXS8_9CNID|nr:unnamed protein product [Porites evermanni]
MSTAKLFLFAMAIAAVFFVDVNARVAAHYNNHEAYNELVKSGDRLHELFSRTSCQCRGEGFSDSGYGSGTTFWFVGCSGNWQDCKEPSFMTSCCREKGKK